MEGKWDWRKFQKIEKILKASWILDISDSPFNFRSQAKKNFLGQSTILVAIP